MPKLTLTKETLQILGHVQVEDIQGGRPNALDTYDTCYCISVRPERTCVC